MSEFSITNFIEFIGFIELLKAINFKYWKLFLKACLSKHLNKL